MVWRGSTIDPTEDVAAPAVLEAFESAREDGLASVDCYRAGVEAWRRAHRTPRPRVAGKPASPQGAGSGQGTTQSRRTGATGRGRCAFLSRVLEQIVALA